MQHPTVATLSRTPTLADALSAMDRFLPAIQSATADHPVIFPVRRRRKVGKGK